MDDGVSMSEHIAEARSIVNLLGQRYGDKPSDAQIVATLLASLPPSSTFNNLPDGLVHSQAAPVQPAPAGPTPAPTHLLNQRLVHRQKPGVFGVGGDGVFGAKSLAIFGIWGLAVSSVLAIKI
ncbi:hypothetical protein C8J57DRAFT_1511526 [Mycena rebaudengoi]|nr:hypothetical protein C8J57DRAFT_1511526 [Mycena rebaudengoi]